MASPQLDGLLSNLRAMGPFNGDITAMRKMLDRSPAYPQPADISVEAVDAGGVPAEWVTPDNAERGRAIVYCHGGGYATGSAATFRGLTTHLARTSRSRVLAIDYRLAPEHPYPAALDDVLAAYRYVIAEHSPDNVAMAGDSSGGGLVLSALVALRDAGDPLPATAACLCPWTDLTLSGASIVGNAEADVMVSPASLAMFADAYVGSGDRKAATVSPLFADLTGLPPLLLEVGVTEILLDDATHFAGKADAAGVDVTLVIHDDGFHVWHSFADLVPEAKDAITHVGGYLDKRLGVA